MSDTPAPFFLAPLLAPDGGRASTPPISLSILGEEGNENRPLSKPKESTPKGVENFFGTPRLKLRELLAEKYSLPKFRADQVFQWVYQKGNREPGSWSNISKHDRLKLESLFQFDELNYHERKVSDDGSRKYLFKVGSSHLIESVLINQPTRKTLCVSSQVGCALGCKFCQTGTMGLTRHLTTAEILKQVMGVLEDAKNFGDTFTNMVFMGMGEPLHNFEGVRDALEILTDDFGLSLSSRRITVSTVGLVPQIKRFFKEKLPANLAVSLNATTDEVRSAIMPINQRYQIAELLSALREAELGRRKRITIEYVMLSGVNDTDQDLARLPKLLKNIPAKINLIPYNENSGLGFKRPTNEHIKRWQLTLNAQGILATVRWSKGRDIEAACGQLVTESKRKKSVAA